MKEGIADIINRARCLDKEEKIAIINLLLKEQEATLESISQKLGIRKSTAYKYLKEMVAAGFISFRKLPGKKGRLAFRAESVSLNIDERRIMNAFDAAGKKPLIIFDVDDTLVRRTDIPEQLAHSGKSAIRDAKLMLQGKGIHISMPPDALFSPEWIFSKYGNSIEWYISTWLNVSGVPETSEKGELVSKYVKDYYSNIEVTSVACRLFNEVKPFLEKLKDSAYFAAISNSSHKAVVENFVSNDIMMYFSKDGKELIVGGDEIPKSKETLEAVLRIAGISPMDCFLIGDTGGDIRVAREAGLAPKRTIAISRGITPIESLRTIRPPVRIIKSLQEIEPLFLPG